MSFLPVIPVGGIAGWQFLQRTMANQQQAFENSTALARDAEYFRDTIGEITQAEQLVNDRRLLSVALGAVGLEDDINNRFYIQKVLEEGSLEDDAFANRLSDKRYLKLTQLFGFGDFETPNTQLSDFADGVISDFQTRQFETAVGQQNADMRLAMNAVRDVSELATSESGDDTKWFTIMGSEPLRTVFETALGLPSEFAALDIDKQLDIFRQKSSQVFGQSEISQFSDPEALDDLVRKFLIRSELADISAGLSSSQTALTLLQSIQY